MDIDTLGALSYFFEALGTLIASLALAGAVVLGGMIGFRAVDPNRVAKREVMMRNSSPFLESFSVDDSDEVILTSERKKPSEVWTPKSPSNAGKVKDQNSEPETTTAGKK